MGFFSDDSDQGQAYNQYNDGEKNEASVSHELLAGAASFYAAKKYEEHCEANGQPESHDTAKELLAGFTGAFVDREAETHGMDFVDREKAKYQARQQAEQGLQDSNQDNTNW